MALPGGPLLERLTGPRLRISLGLATELSHGHGFETQASFH
jgi:hypothetical protein